MKVALLSVLAAQELIDDVRSHVEAFRSQSEFSMDINNPLEEESSRGVFDFCLNVDEVICINHIFLFFSKVRLVDILRELSDCERIVVSILIAFRNILEVFFLLLSNS